jgi:hypothetical protein
MRRLLIVLVLAVAGIVGLGFYQGWLRLATGEAGGKASLPVTVDWEKFEQDKVKAQEKVHELEQQVQEKVLAAPDAGKEGRAEDRGTPAR